VIEFQVEQEVAPMIGDKIAGAGIPLIAIDIPHPHATYFGVDNYRVGIEAGEALGIVAVEPDMLEPGVPDGRGNCHRTTSTDQAFLRVAFRAR